MLYLSNVPLKVNKIEGHQSYDQFVLFYLSDEDMSVCVPQSIAYSFLSKIDEANKNIKGL